METLLKPVIDYTTGIRIDSDGSYIIEKTNPIAIQDHNLLYLVVFILSGNFPSTMKPSALFGIPNEIQFAGSYNITKKQIISKNKLSSLSPDVKNLFYFTRHTINPVNGSEKFITFDKFLFNDTLWGVIGTFNPKKYFCVLPPRSNLISVNQAVITSDLEEVFICQDQLTYKLVLFTKDHNDEYTPRITY